MAFKYWIKQALGGSPKLLRAATKIYVQFVERPRNLFVVIRWELKSGSTMHPGNSTYCGDGFATSHHVAFLDDSRFIESYLAAWDAVPPPLRDKRDNLGIIWRAHIVTWAANQIKALEGDWVECGVNFGLLPRIAFNFVPETSESRVCWFVDSWGDPTLAELNHPNYRHDIFDEVRSRFKDQSNVRFVRGLVPDALDVVAGRKIAFLGIDMNGSVAERAALDLLYSHVVPGGIIYFDDYGWEFPELRATVNDFFSDKPEELLHFPSGNSIVVKR